MLPPFNADGVLPPGVHPATWEEIVTRFGWNDRRRYLLHRMEDVLLELCAAGCTTVYLNGSFVTDKDEPGDYDLCWEREGVRQDELPIVLQDPFAYPGSVRNQYGGDVFPADQPVGVTGSTFFMMFQLDRPHHSVKGDSLPKFGGDMTLITEDDYYSTKHLLTLFEENLGQARKTLKEGLDDEAYVKTYISSLRYQIADFHEQLAEYEAREQAPLQKAA